MWASRKGQVVTTSTLALYGQELRNFSYSTGSKDVWLREFSKDGRFGISSGLENAARVWNLETGKKAAEFDGRMHNYSATLSADNKLALLGGSDGARLWNLSPLRELHHLRGSAEHIYAVALSSDSKRALTGGSEGEIRLWDLTSGKTIQVMRQKDAVGNLVFSPDARRATSVNASGKLIVWGLVK